MENDTLLGLIEKFTQSLGKKPSELNANNGQTNSATPKNQTAKNKIIEVLRKHDEISKRIDKNLNGK